MSTSSASGANFFVYCKNNGEKGYYITTDFVTGSGYVRYRVGHNPIQTQTWSESSSTGFKTLTPPSFDINLLKQLYQNWDFLSQLDRYAVGIVDIGFTASGFPAAIDKTRADCGWSTDMFPPNNGWSTSYPDTPPVDAIEATYVPNSPSQFGLIAWRDTNPIGAKQLLVRLGQNKSLCKGSTYISDRLLYVLQDGKRVSAVSGMDFSLSCSSQLPVTFALQGDFDASKPFVLNAYPFHLNTLNPGAPISSVAFN